MVGIFIFSVINCANSSGIPIDAMYPNTAKKAQSYFNALDSANGIKKLVNSAVPPSGS